MTDENKALISFESKGAYLVLNLFGLKLRIRKINRFEIKIKYNYLLKELKIKTGLGFQDYTQNTIIMFMMMFNKYRDEFKKSFELIIKAEDYIPKSNKKYLGYSIYCDDKKSMYIPDPTFYSWVNCGCESFKDYTEKIESEGGVNHYMIKSFG